MLPENRAFVAAEQSLMLSTVTVRQTPENDKMPKWASRRLDQAQAYAISNMNAIYFVKWLSCCFAAALMRASQTKR
jgi:hypothetical protein